MRNFLYILFGLLIVGCSTTNRQVIIECSNASCYKPKRPSVATTMNSTNMTSKVNYPSSNSSSKPKASSHTNSVTTNNITTNSSAFVSYEEETIVALFDRNYIFQ